jgi:hypothetical protein
VVVLTGAGLLSVAAAATATAPVPVKATTRNENTPAASAGYFAWSKSRLGKPKTFDVWAQATGEVPFKVNAPKTVGWAGGIDGTRLAYQEVWKQNSDIRLFDLVTRRRSNPPGVNTKRWEWRATISGDWLLFGRGRIFTPATQQVILRNLVTGEQRMLDTVRNKNGMLQPGQVNGNYSVWMRCNPSPSCNVFRYDLMAGKTTQMPSTGQVQYGPSVTPSGTTYYGRSGPSCGDSAQLVKTALDGTTEVLYSLPAGRDFFSSFALVLTRKPPLPPVTTTRIYFDYATCRPDRQDIYSLDDSQRLPPASPPPGAPAP